MQRRNAAGHFGVTLPGEEGVFAQGNGGDGQETGPSPREVYPLGTPRSTDAPLVAPLPRAEPGSDGLAMQSWSLRGHPASSTPLLQSEGCPAEATRPRRLVAHFPPFSTVRDDDSAPVAPASDPHSGASSHDSGPGESPPYWEVIQPGLSRLVVPVPAPDAWSLALASAGSRLAVGARL